MQEVSVSDQMTQMKNTQRCKYPDEEIKEDCNDFEYTLTVWNSIFSYCQFPNPGELEIGEEETNIKLGMKQMTKMGMIITSNSMEQKNLLPYN